MVGIQRSTADRDGKHLDVADCIVFELKDGKVTDGPTSRGASARCMCAHPDGHVFRIGGARAATD